jgi:N-acetylmuramoyl-L-alanine amidase
VLGEVIKKGLQFGLFLFVFLFAFPAFGSAEKVVVIDPGHGGAFTGTCGYTREPGKDLCERDVNLNVSLKIREALKGSGITVYLTRETDTHFAPFLKNADGSLTGGDYDLRMKKANAYASGNNDNSIFVSVHHNASPTSMYVKGYETYYYDGVKHAKPEYPHDPLQIKYLPDSKRLAETTHPNVVTDLGLIDRNIRSDQSFVVIRNAQMPSILVELGYMTNPQEEARIKTADYQTKAAKALAKGIINYFKVFEVYKENSKIATFKTKTEAINFASKQNGFIQVFDKDQQSYIWDNSNFQVYHKSTGLLKSFGTQEEAIAFAQQNGETRVVAKNTNYTIWSNYLNKNYVLTDVSESYYRYYYDVNEAIAVASQSMNRKVLKKGTNEVIWTNISGLSVTRKIDSKKISGVDRWETAINVSKELYPKGFPADKAEKTVILATGLNPWDALSAASLSPVYDNAPLLLSRTVENLLPELKNELVRLGAKKVIIVGGTGIVGASIEKGINDLGIATERLHGINRYETNLQILSKLENVKGVFLASGESYADALAAAPIAAANDWGIVLTLPNTITPEALTYLKDKEIAILGGNGVITEQIENKVVSQNGSNQVHRLGGLDRYETNAAMLWHFKDQVKSTTVHVTTGTNFPDAMVAAPLSIGNKAPLILVNNIVNELNKNIESFLMKYAEENSVSNVDIIGGMVSDPVKTTIINKLK